MTTQIVQDPDLGVGEVGQHVPNDRDRVVEPGLLVSYCRGKCRNKHSLLPSLVNVDESQGNIVSTSAAKQAVIITFFPSGGPAGVVCSFVGVGAWWLKDHWSLSK